MTHEPVHVAAAPPPRDQHPPPDDRGDDVLLLLQQLRARLHHTERSSFRQTLPALERLLAGVRLALLLACASGEACSLTLWLSFRAAAARSGQRTESCRERTESRALPAAAACRHVRVIGVIGARAA